MVEWLPVRDGGGCGGVWRRPPALESTLTRYCARASVRELLPTQNFWRLRRLRDGLCFFSVNLQAVYSNDPLDNRELYAKTV